MVILRSKPVIWILLFGFLSPDSGFSAEGEISQSETGSWIGALESLNSAPDEPVEACHDDGQGVSDSPWEIIENAQAPIPEQGTDLAGIREMNRAIVQECMEELPEGRREVIWELSEGAGANFEIAKVNGRIRLKLKTYFHIDPKTVDPAIGKERIVQVRKRIAACQPRIRKVWERYGLDLDLQFFSVSERGRDKKGVKHTQVIYDSGRSDEDHWYFKGSPGEAAENEEDNFCLMMFHELGHQLGLPDQYPDPARPNRKTVFLDGPPYSYMAFYSLGGWQGCEIYPADVGRILRRVCAVSDRAKEAQEAASKKVQGLKSRAL